MSLPGKGLFSFEHDDFLRVSQSESCKGYLKYFFTAISISVFEAKNLWGPWASEIKVTLLIG